MMNEIKVEYGYTKNMGNYESERMLVSATITLGGVTAPEVVMEEEMEKLKAFVHRKMNIVKDDSPPRKRRMPA
jgi:hypothetical protein